MKLMVKYWKYPWPNLCRKRNLIIHTCLEEPLIILFLPMVVVATWEIHMVLMVAVVLHTTSQ